MWQTESRVWWRGRYDRGMTTSRRLLITAGPVHEPIDAVRYLGNRSSGRLGLALAAAGRDAGWSVRLLLGPITATPPDGVDVARFESTADLERLLTHHFVECDVLIMAAAVADYRPRPLSHAKIPRGPGVRMLELEPTPDLVAACASVKRPHQHIVAFALEDPSLLETRAREKLRRKRVDAIVANPLTTMGAGTIDATLFTADGQAVQPLRGDQDSAEGLSKVTFARWLIDWIGQVWR